MKKKSENKPSKHSKKGKFIPKAKPEGRQEGRPDKKSHKAPDPVNEFMLATLSVFHKNPGITYNYKQIASRLGIDESADRQKIQTALQSLVSRAHIEEIETGKFKIVPQSQYIIGKVDMTSSGAAYLIPQDKEKYKDDIYIPANATNKSLHGDIVRVYVFKRKNERRPEGEVVEIITRAKTQFVGRLELSEHFGFVVPDNNRVNINFYIPKENILPNAKNGDKVIVEIAQWPEKATNPVGKILDVLGTPGDHDVEIHSILAEYGLPYKFAQFVEDEAAGLPLEITDEEVSKRRDMRPSTTFTIDPFDAKDFDDALSIDKLPNGNWEIGVHIADVSHYVTQGTSLDAEAYERATSVYLVDRVVPMLPEILSNNVCSLRPNEDKLTFSAVFEIDQDANVINEWFGRTVTHSNKRFTYEEAQLLIEGGEGDLKEEVLELDRLAKIMRQRRLQDGAISFDRAEVKFTLDDKSEPIGVFFKEAKDSNKLIEEFMLLANRRVAHFVGSELKKEYKGEAPTFVYRIHDNPNPDKLFALSSVAKEFGYKLNLKDSKSVSASLNRLLKDSYGKKESNMMTTLAMRSMAKAEYSTQNIGHYGLSFEYYSHFTSPIRRYPDVMAHRLLQHYLDKGKPADKDLYQDMCKHSSERERVAADAERDSIKYMQVKYMAKQADQEFLGVISGVTEWGIYVEIIENKCEGMVRLRDIRDDYYSFDAKNYAIVGENSHNTIRLGDQVVVKVKNADLERKQLDFHFVRVAE